jgi:hypothetical protein
MVIIFIITFNKISLFAFKSEEKHFSPCILGHPNVELFYWPYITLYYITLRISIPLYNGTSTSERSFGDRWSSATGR